MINMRIGPVKYEKVEEGILLRSFILGMFFGLPLGLLLNYMLGFSIIPKQAPSDLLGWFIMAFTVPMSWCSLWLVLTIILAFLFCKKRNLFKSWYDVGRILLAWLLFPAVLMYTALIFSVFMFPVDVFLVPFLDPLVGAGVLRLIGLIIMIPFMFIFIAIVLPDSKPRKMLNRSFRRLKRKIRKLH